jgi:hypothetical protein
LYRKPRASLPIPHMKKFAPPRAGCFNRFG